MRRGPEGNMSRINLVTSDGSSPLTITHCPWTGLAHLSLLWVNSFPQGSVVPLVNNSLPGRNALLILQTCLWSIRIDGGFSDPRSHSGTLLDIGFLWPFSMVNSKGVCVPKGAALSKITPCSLRPPPTYKWIWNFFRSYHRTPVYETISFLKFYFKK